MRLLLAMCLLEAGCVQVLGASEPALGGAPTPIQDIMGPDSDPGHVPLGAAVAVTRVFVTGASASRATLFIQEPTGVTTAGHTYPVFSATRAFFPSVNFEFPSVGDCVDIEGTVVLFLDALEISATSLAVVDPAECGTPPAPLAIPSTNPPVTFADLQSKVTPTSGSAGPKVAQYENVLLTFTNVKIMTAPDAEFNDAFYFAPQAATSGPVVVVTNFLVAPPTLTVGMPLQAITGVYPAVSGNRILNPRSAADYDQ